MAAVVDESAAHYRVVADSIPHLVWTARADGWADFFNRRFQDYTGLGGKQLEGWGWKPIVHADDLGRYLAAWSQALQTGESFEIEYRLRRADGAYRWHHATAVPARGTDGHVERWFGTCTDIEARQGEARFRGLTQLTADTYWEQDEHYRFTSFIKSGAMRPYGLGERARIGSQRWDNGYVNMTQADWARHRAELEARRPFYELELCRIEEGRKLWVSTSGEPVFDAAGTFRGYRGIGRDITARKRGDAMLELEHSVTTILASAGSESAALADVMRKLCESEGWECGRYFCVDEPAGVLRFANAWGIADPDIARFIAASRDMTCAPGQGIAGQVWQSGQPQWAARGPDVLTFPLRSEGKTLGVLSFNSRQPRAPDQRLLQAASVIGSQVGQFLQRKRSEEVLRKSEQRFQLFMEHLPALAWLRDSSLRYVYINRLYEKELGITRQDAVGKVVTGVYSPAVARRFRETDRQVQQTRRFIEYFDDVPLGDGSPRRWLKIKFPVPFDDGIGVGGIALDVTERSRLEEALRESEHRFRTFMENTPAVAWIKDARFRYTYVNHAFERTNNWAAKDIIGGDDFKLFPEDFARQVRADDAEVLRAGKVVQKLREVPPGIRPGASPESRTEHWLVVKFPFPDASGENGVAGIAIDVTERVEAEELAHRYAGDVRSLLERLVAAQESERRRLADDLHDLIGQNLTALGIELSTVKAGLPEDVRARAAPRLEAMSALLDGTIEAIRGVMAQLRPPGLEEFGLLPALRSYAAEFSERTGMKVSTRVAGPERRLPGDTELALFRIVQEALTNAARHSGGEAAQISLFLEPCRIHLCVEDDGCGFTDPVGARRNRRGGRGLPAMRERAEAIGGSLRLEFPGRGTRVIVEMPLADAD